MSLPSERQATWLIAKRAAVEALHDRATLLMSTFFAFIFPLVMVLAVIRPIASSDPRAGTLSAVLATYVLIVGVIPTTAAVGVAAGQFAGEKEQGNLAPLLASPASNVAIFGGKVLGAVMPAVMFGALAECAYMAGLLLTLGAAKIALIPLALGLAMLLLAPGVALFAAILASLISSRVRTFTAAQQISSILLLPLWAVLIGTAFAMTAWGTWYLALAILLVYGIDAGLTVVSAKTWRREEVLARA